MDGSRSHFKMMVVSGNGNRKLADETSTKLGLELANATVGRFEDDEVEVEFGENMRGADLFCLNPTTAPAENIIELALMADAAHSSKGRTTAVIPCFGYQCQERKTKPRTPISAKVMARFLSIVGFDRIVLFEPHTDAMEGFFHDVRVEKAYATPIVIEYLMKQLMPMTAENLVIAPADMGGGKKSEAYLTRLHRLGYTDIELAGSHKIRNRDGSITIKLIGDFEGRHIVTIEDMIRSGSTAITHARAVRERGALSYTLIGFHPVLTSVKRCEELATCDAIDRIVVLDTLPISDEKLAALGSKLTVLTVSTLFAKIIKALHYDESISKFLDYEGYTAKD